jgi:hypothetical protein
VLIALAIVLVVCVVLLIGLCAIWLDGWARTARELRRRHEQRALHGADAVECFLEDIDWQWRASGKSNGHPILDPEDEAA